MNNEDPKNDAQSASQDLEELLGQDDSAVAPDRQGKQEKIDPITYVALTIKGLETSIEAIQLALTEVSVRLDSLERYSSYLLSKDPEFMENLQKNPELAARFAQEQEAAKIEKETDAKGSETK
jgi:hypothetical protein